jgi:homoaconitase/3-isopropylmalate dehydratase large subunit
MSSNYCIHTVNRNFCPKMKSFPSMANLVSHILAASEA